LALRGWKFVLISVSVVVPAFGSIAFEPPASLNGTSGPPVNLGLVFTANSSFSVDALGFYFLEGVADGVVALYDSSGNLLTSTPVTLVDSLFDGFLYKSISPITLTAGSQYTVNEFSSNGIWAFGASPTTSAEITYDSHVFAYASELTFPADTFHAAGGAYYGPNFRIASEVPEPGTMLLFMPGLLAMLGVAARRARCESGRVS
jgi:hypothetical protein